VVELLSRGEEARGRADGLNQPNNVLSYVAVAEGAIKLKQFGDIEAFVADGAGMRDGTAIAADLIVLASSYKRLGRVRPE
jgi:hypothetical protein